MTMFSATFCAILIAYLVGAIPWGFIIARLRGIDIRTVGSGNIGATNVFRTVGKGWGLLTFILDAAKGFAPTFFLPRALGHVSIQVWPTDRLGLLFATLAIVGHMWPIYLRFKGGKGIATSVGALLGMAPATAAAGLAIWIMLFVTTRYVSVASIGASFAVGASAWYFYAHQELWRPIVLSILAVVAIARHSRNIARLARGTEPRVSWGRYKLEAAARDRDTAEGR